MRVGAGRINMEGNCSAPWQTFSSILDMATTQPPSIWPCPPGLQFQQLPQQPHHGLGGLRHRGLVAAGEKQLAPCTQL